MALLGTLIGFVLTLFIVVLIARMVLDWLGMVPDRPAWTRRAQDLARSATEPVIAPVRRVVAPVRLGGISLDLAFTIVFVGALILRSVAYSL